MKTSALLLKLRPNWTCPWKFGVVCLMNRVEVVLRVSTTVPGHPGYLQRIIKSSSDIRSFSTLLVGLLLLPGFSFVNHHRPSSNI